MPKRVLDGEALWSSSKLMGCAPWAKAEYAWLYPIADGNGSFELTNLRVIHGKVAAIRPEWTEDQLRMTLSEFRKNGLLFVWKQEGKIYGHWTGSEKTGRLPSSSERGRYQMFAPPVPKDLLFKYLEQYRDRIAMLSRQERELDLDWEKEKEGVPDAASSKDAQAKNQPSRSIELPAAFEGTHLRITEKMDKLFAQAFPWVERKIEYARADAWLEANPERRPKKQNRFIDNWFRRIKGPGENGNGARSTSRESERHERSQSAIANVVGHRSRLADRLREGLSGRGERGADAGLLGGGQGAAKP